jgi:hypothetical protein
MVFSPLMRHLMRIKFISYKFFGIISFFDIFLPPFSSSCFLGNISPMFPSSVLSFQVEGDSCEHELHIFFLGSGEVHPGEAVPLFQGINTLSTR